MHVKSNGNEWQRWPCDRLSRSLWQTQNTLTVIGTHRQIWKFPCSRSSLGFALAPRQATNIEINKPWLRTLEPWRSTPNWWLPLSTAFRGWTKTWGSTPHWWLSSLNTTFRVEPIAHGNQYGMMEFILHLSIFYSRNKPWEYKPKPNRNLVHSPCANRNEPKRTKISNKVLYSSGILYSLLQFVSLRCIWFETWNNSSNNKPTPTSTMHRTPTNYMRELMVLMVGWRSGSLKMLLKLFPLR